MAHPIGRHWATVTTMLAVGVLGGCRQVAPPPALPPLGPGTQLEFTVPGAVALAPVIAARPPLVAVAFATRDSRGARVYLSSSADNGASFTEPTPVDDDGADMETGDEELRLLFGPPAAQPSARPSVRLEWRRADGRTVSRLVHPWRREPFRGVPMPVEVVREQAVASCAPDGEVLLVAGFRGRGPVSVNHAMADGACVPQDQSAVTDARQWVHAVWVGGPADDTRRVLYAASSDRQWFGGAQPLVDTGQQPSNVSLVTDPNDTVVAVWDGTARGTRHVFLRQLLPSHHGPATLLPLTRLTGDAGGSHPSLASITGGVIVVWRMPSTGGLGLRRVGLDAVCAVPTLSTTVSTVSSGTSR